MTKRSNTLLFFGLLVVFIFCSLGFANRGDKKATNGLIKPTVENQFTLSGNNWAFEMTNYGSYAQDLEGRLPGGGSGGEFPKGTGTYIIFAAGIQVGAMVDGVPKVSAVEFDSEFQPGALTKNNANDSTEVPVATDWGSSTNKLFALYKDGTDGTPSGANGDDIDDYTNWPRQYGAPVDTNDNPLIIGDLMSWCVFNDMDPDRHKVPDDSQKDPLGLEIQQTSIQVDIPGYNNVFFMYYKIINKGTQNLRDVYIAAWYDPDVDKSSNDLIATDTTRRMVFTYNSDDTDPVSQGGSAFGADFFQGPVVEGTLSDTAHYLELTPKGFVKRDVAGKKALGLSTTVRYINVRGPDGDPDNDAELYNLMKGLEKNGNPKTSPFTYPADPLTASTSELDPRPDDKRMSLVTGPFNLSVGDTQIVVVGNIGGKGTNPSEAIRNLRETDEIAQKAYDAAFILPQPPPSPNLTATALNGRVVLTWDNSSEFYEDNYPVPDYRTNAFAGYKLYRSSSGVTGTWELLSQYDKKDGITAIPETTLVNVDGIPVLAVNIVPIGNDNGLGYSYIDRDVINGMTYYYSVTAYSAQPYIRSGTAPVTLESSQNTNSSRVTPQPERLGYVYDATSQENASYYQIDTTQPTSDGQVLTAVLDPTKVKNNNIYKVTFNSDFSWNIIDSTTGNVLIANWTNQGAEGENAFPTVDGIEVKALGPPLAAKDEYTYRSLKKSPLDSTYSQGRWFTGTGAGEAFFGGVYLGPNFSVSTVPAGQYPKVEILFTPVTSYVDLDSNGKFNNGEPYQFDTTALSDDGRIMSSKAFMYTTWGESTYTGFNYIPFSAWDVDANPPRQLNIVVRDRNGNNQWELSNATVPPDTLLPLNGDAQYQYTWIMASDYDSTGIAYNPTGGIDFMATSGDYTDNYYVLWLGQRGDRMFLAEGASFTIFPNRINLPNDYFVFSSTSKTPFNKSLAESHLNKKYIKVVPNPYYGFSSYDVNQFNRQVKITGLPNECTIRIFNVAGDLVRTIQHNGTSTNDRSNDLNAEFTSIEIWDLTTNNGLFVSSGVYFIYIDAPGIGKTEKPIPFAIIQGNIQLTVPTN